MRHRGSPRPIGLACDELRRQQANVRFLLTPAGFLPLKLAPDQVLVGGWDTPAEDFETLIGVATDGVETSSEIRLRVGAPQGAGELPPGRKSACAGAGHITGVLAG
jgi:hypothetical protein